MRSLFANVTRADRLRAAGVFASHKEEEESAVDISEESTGYANGNASATETSTDELRVANSSEEDGFEKVAAPEKSEETMTGDDSTTSEEAFTEIQDRSKLELGDDLVDEPLSPQTRTLVEKMDDEDEIPSPMGMRNSGPLSPTTASLEEKVRRVSLEDTAMTSPPNERDEASVVDATSPSLKTESPNALGLSPRPEDTPAPLFSKSSDPNKTPTPQSPETATSPTSREDITETSEVKPEGDSSTNAEENASTLNSNIETDIDGKPVVGDYLKIMFVENKVVPTILVCYSTAMKASYLPIHRAFLPISMEQLSPQCSL